MLNTLNMNKKRFFVLSLCSSSGFVILLSILLLTGTGYAAFPLAGVGGFVIEANKITGTNFTLTPKTGSTERHENWGQAHIELGSTSIDGLSLTKTISLDGAFAEYGISNIHLAITSDSTVRGENVKLGVTGIVASHSNFQNLNVDENKRASNPLDVFQLRASSLTLDQAQLNTHFLSASRMNIPQLQVDIEINH